MRSVNIHEAKTHLSRLVEAAAAGERDHHRQGGEASGQASRHQGRPAPALSWLDGGKDPDCHFDAPLPPAVLAEFLGEA